jgi:hypothetical protein
LPNEGIEAMNDDREIEEFPSLTEALHLLIGALSLVAVILLSLFIPEIFFS